MEGKQGGRESHQGYREWSARTLPDEAELAAMRRQLALRDHPPRVSLLLVACEEDEVWITASVSSVMSQVYDRVEICLCDNASSRPHVAEVLQRLSRDDRVETCGLADRESRARAWNEALTLATGEYVAVLDPGDEVAPDSLFRAVEVLVSADADLVYTDEDEVDVAGRRSDPTFKPPWSPDLLLSADYVGRLAVFRRRLVQEVGGFRQAHEGAEEYDLALRVAEISGRIRHLPQVGYNRRRLPGASPTRDTTARAGALGEALDRRGIEAVIDAGVAPGSLRVVRDVPPDLRITVISMAVEPHAQHRRKLEDTAGYPIHELIEPEAGRETGAVAVRDGFPARSFNQAAQRAEGEYLVLLSGGTRPVTNGWLAEMLRHAHRPEVGAVGGSLAEVDGGGPAAGTAKALAQLSGDRPPSFPPPARDHPGNLPVAGGWMAIRRTVFEEAGGFDEENLPAAFYDLDLSLRLAQAGMLNVNTPHATAIDEPVRRRQPAAQEIAYMWDRWWSALVELLYYTSSPVREGYDRGALDTVLAASTGRAVP